MSNLIGKRSLDTEAWFETPIQNELGSEPRPKVWWNKLKVSKDLGKKDKKLGDVLWQQLRLSNWKDFDKG